VNLTIALVGENDGNAIPFEVMFGGDATLDEDYGVVGTNNIANGLQSTTITLNAINDNDIEG